MQDRENQEKKSKRLGFLVSFIVQVALLLTLYFLVAWEAPDPPLPVYGIELGMMESSSSASSSSSSSQQKSETTEEQIEQEQVEEISTSQTEETETIEETPTQNNEEPQPVEETVKSEDAPAVEPVKQQKADSSKEPTPAKEKVQEKKQKENVEKKPEKKKEAKKSEDKPNSTEETAEKDNKTIDNRAIYKGGGNSGNSKGSSSGASLAMAGWVWDFKPKPKDTSEDSGKIVYRIVVDQDGYLVKINVLTSTVSQTVERIYRKEVEKLTFSKTAEYNAASQSTGTITFIIKSR